MNVLLVPAHPGFPGQIPQSRKTVVVVVVVVTFFIFCDPQHLPYVAVEPGNLFLHPHSLSFSLHNSYIFSPNHSCHFLKHAHTVSTYFAAAL